MNKPLLVFIPSVIVIGILLVAILYLLFPQTVITESIEIPFQSQQQTSCTILLDEYLDLIKKGKTGLERFKIKLLLNGDDYQALESEMAPFLRELQDKQKILAEQAQKLRCWEKTDDWLTEDTITKMQEAGLYDELKIIKDRLGKLYVTESQFETTSNRVETSESIELQLEKFVYCTKSTKTITESKELGLASFVDESKDPQYYVDRYDTEASYKKWFDENYPEYSSIYEAVGLEEPIVIPAFVDPNQDPQRYVDRYNNEVSYKKWFDENYPEYSSICEAMGLENDSKK